MCMSLFAGTLLSNRYAAYGSLEGASKDDINNALHLNSNKLTYQYPIFKVSKDETKIHVNGQKV